jgi:hypothetical protein
MVFVEGEVADCKSISKVGDETSIARCEYSVQECETRTARACSAEL